MSSLCEEDKCIEKINEMTDGSACSNHGWGGDSSGKESSSEESFENYNNNDNNSFANNDPTVDKDSISASFVKYSSSKYTQYEDKSNETLGGEIL